MPDWVTLFSSLRANDIKVAMACTPQPITGGDISSAWRIDALDHQLFLKTGPVSAYDSFLAEADGLTELKQANALRIPEVLHCGVSSADSFLVLEWIDFESVSARAEEKLGEQLAQQHKCLSKSFGWYRDNIIGSTPQRNQPSDDWLKFFSEFRLGFQLELAAANGYRGQLEKDGQKLLNSLAGFFENHSPEPSLLHGDLWGGNWAVADGNPVLFDPAVYYGDRETDLAMTELFGGFGDSFYVAYDRTWPLSPGFGERRLLYQLYHVLNHLNIFGVGYLRSAHRIIKQLI